MSVEIIKAKLQDLQLLYNMQIKSFKPLLEKYKDYDMSPGNETIEQIKRKFNQAQETFRLLEEFYHDSKKWELDTILEEKGNCYLYEKLGYRKTGKIEIIKDGMTIVYYEKLIKV